jgi:hypothetical protein
MATGHRVQYVCRPADVLPPEQALPWERRVNGWAWDQIAATCPAVRQHRVIPVLHVSNSKHGEVWAPITWQHRPVWMRTMSALCADPVCAHREFAERSAQQAWELASPRLRSLRRRAHRRRAARTR